MSSQRAESSPSESPSTASAEEIARFGALADTWWDANGPFRPLHRINPVRIAFIRDRLAGHFGADPLDQPLKGLTVLDIGCGGGLLSEPLCRLGAAVTGIDASERNIEAARAHAEATELDITYRSIVPEQLAREEDRFDAVLAMEVVEHVADIDRFVQACESLLSGNGLLVLSTLNRTLKSFALAKIGAEYILRWVPPGTHDWRKFVRPSELAAALRRSGLEITELAGVTFNPLLGEWNLDKDLDVNYMACAKRPAASPAVARG